MHARSEPLSVFSMLLLLGAVGLKRIAPGVPSGAVAIVGCVALALGGYSILLWRREQAADAATRALSRRYLREYLPAMLGYVVAVLVSVWLLRRIEAPALRAAVALLPVVPIGLALRATARYIRDVDELQRRIELEAVSLGSVGVGFAYMTAGFLQAARVVNVPAAVAMFWVFPLLCLGYGIAKCLVARRYG